MLQSQSKWYDGASVLCAGENCETSPHGNKLLRMCNGQSATCHRRQSCRDYGVLWRPVTSPKWAGANMATTKAEADSAHEPNSVSQTNFWTFLTEAGFVLVMRQKLSGPLKVRRSTEPSWCSRYTNLQAGCWLNRAAASWGGREKQNSP